MGIPESQWQSIPLKVIKQEKKDTTCISYSISCIHIQFVIVVIFKNEVAINFSSLQNVEVLFLSTSHTSSLYSWQLVENILS